MSSDVLFDSVLLGESTMRDLAGGLAEATCSVCGCTDSRGCPPDVEGGTSCSWVFVNRANGVGLCSVCDENRDSWEEDGVGLEVRDA